MLTTSLNYSLRAKTEPLEGDPDMITPQLEVQDSGRGIEPEQQEHIFEAFVQVRHSGRE